MRNRTLLIAGLIAAGSSMPHQTLNTTSQAPTHEEQFLATPLEKAVFEAYNTYEKERATVEAYKDVRLARLKTLGIAPMMTEELHHPLLEDEKGELLKLRTGTLNEREKTFLKAIDNYGAQLINPKNRQRYDKTFKNIVEENKHLKPADCTLSLLEDLANNGQYEKLLEDYEKKTYSVTEFPWVAAMHFRQDYTPILIIADTATDGRYRNGSRKGGRNDELLRTVRQGNYYTDVDYPRLSEKFKNTVIEEYGLQLAKGTPTVEHIITNDDINTPTIKTLLKHEDGIVAIHDNYHYGFLTKGQFIDTKWAANPLYTNNIQSRDFIKALQLPDDADGKIHNAILWLPKEDVRMYNLDNYVVD